jgi:hypothetical protein
MRAKPVAFAIENTHQPVNVLIRRAVQSKPAYLQRHHVKTSNVAAVALHPGKVHYGEIAAESFVSLDALIIIDEIATAVNYQAIAVNLDRFWVMRGMTMMIETPARSIRP